MTDFLMRILSSVLAKPKSFLILLALLGPSFLGRVTVVRPNYLKIDEKKLEFHRIFQF